MAVVETTPNGRTENTPEAAPMTEQEHAASVRVSDLAAFQKAQGEFQMFVSGKLEIINRELGELAGELRAIKWMMGGGLLLAVLLRVLT